VSFNVVAFLLKATIVETAETAVARKELCNHACCSAVAQYPSRDRCDTLAIMETTFFVRSVPGIYNEDQLSSETAVIRVGGKHEMAANLRRRETRSRGTSILGRRY
jgi:hypothetical protein